MKLKPEKHKSQNYLPILLLLSALTLGGIVGHYFPQKMLFLKPVGDIFLNLLLASVVPLIFFTVSSSIAELEINSKLGRLFGTTLLVFASTIAVAITIPVIVLHFFPISFTLPTSYLASPTQQTVSSSWLANIYIVSNFIEMFSQKCVLPLILFAILLGLMTRKAGNSGEKFRNFLASGSLFMKRLLNLIMRGAPIGLGVYFGCQIATEGHNPVKGFSHVLIAAHAISLFYYLIIFSSYALLSGGFIALIRYWKSNISPSIIAVATCSSIATLPSTLRASVKMGIPPNLGEILMPLGIAFHKEGSAIITIVGLSLLGTGFDNWNSCLLAGGVALLVSIIEGSIPSGGFTGQLLIVSIYHLPSGVWPIIMILTTLLDPVATLLNVSGSITSGILITRLFRD